jgi:hypothetical protein
VSEVGPLTGPNGAFTSDGLLRYYAPTGEKVPVGASATIICATYGHAEDLKNLGITRLWDYTTQGWFNDNLLETDSPTAVVPTCTGNVSHPSAGSGAPSDMAGPFPLYSGGQSVDVRSDPSLTADTQTTLSDGDYVTLECQTSGDTVDAPDDRQGQPIGSSAQWDRISAPTPGYVPDALVNSSQGNTSLPPC